MKHRNKPQETEFEPPFHKWYKGATKLILYPTLLSAIAINAANFLYVVKNEMFSNPPLKHEQIEEKLFQGAEKSFLVNINTTLGKPGRELGYLLFEKD